MSDNLESAVYRALGGIPELKPFIPGLVKLVQDERHAAAEAMRESCITILLQSIPRAFLENIVEQIKALPLDMPNDGRG